MFQADPVWDIFHKSLLYFKTTSHSKHLEKTIFFVNWQNSKGLMKNSDKVIDRNERMYIYISYSHCKGIKVLLPSPERETYKYIPLLKLIKQFNVLCLNRFWMFIVYFIETKEVFDNYGIIYLMMLTFNLYNNDLSWTKVGYLTING